MMKTNKESLKSVMDRRLSFLDEVPSCRPALMVRIAQEEEPRMKKKVSIGFVFVMILALLSVAALMIIMVSGGGAVLRAEITLGTLYVFLQYINSFFEPIQELADAQGISIDEAVQLRVEKNLEAAEVPIEVSVRPIEPQGKLIGFASVNIGGIVIDDFKVVNGKNGIFLGEPSKPDPTTRTGYRSTARVTNRALQERLSAAAADGYNMAVEKLIARAEALRPKPIREQMANAAKEAAKENATRPAPAKGKEARDDR